MANFVNPEDTVRFVKSIRPFSLVDIGTAAWFDHHEVIVQLSQQAFLEASEQREEEVKELLVVEDKLKVLIHEAYSVVLWKTRVLPHLLEINPNPQATFMIYSVLYHEGAAIALLDTSLFHSSVCEALKDQAIDLIDYSIQGITQVIGLVSLGYSKNVSKFDVDESVISELERQKRDIIYKIGLRCISMMNYVSDNVDALPLSTTRRLVLTHDLPWLLIELLHMRPWQRKSKTVIEKFIDEKWTPVNCVTMQKVVKHEAQTWFCLNNILLNKNIMQLYHINNERRTQLLRCQSMLNEVILDQLPPLIQLKQFMARLAVSGPVAATKKSFLLEEVPKIRNNILIAADKYGGFVKIAEKQDPIFLTKDKTFIMNMARRMNAMYNTELIAAHEPQSKAADAAAGTTATAEDKPVNQCSKCAEFAQQKCGKCCDVFYCSRKCQRDDWPAHKLICMKAKRTS